MFSDHLFRFICLFSSFERKGSSVSFIIWLIKKRKCVIILLRENVIPSTAPSTSGKAVVDRKEKCCVQQRSGEQKTRRGWLKRQLRGVMCLYYGSCLLPNARCKSYVHARAISTFRCVPSRISSLRSQHMRVRYPVRVEDTSGGFYARYLMLHNYTFIQNTYFSCLIAGGRACSNEDLKKENERSFVKRKSYSHTMRTDGGRIYQARLLIGSCPSFLQSHLNFETAQRIDALHLSCELSAKNHLPRLTFFDFGQSHGSTRWTDVRACACIHWLQYTPK